MSNTTTQRTHHKTAAHSRNSSKPAAGYYPAYMRKKRKAMTAEELKQADAIRQHLTALAHQDGYGVTYYTDSRGRHMARIGRTDGQGVGFMLTAQQAREWLQ